MNKILKFKYNLAQDGQYGFLNILEQDPQITNSSSNPLGRDPLFTTSSRWKIQSVNCVEVRARHKKIFIMGSDNFTPNSKHLNAFLLHHLSDVRKALEEFRVRFCGQEEDENFPLSPRHRLTRIFK